MLGLERRETADAAADDDAHPIVRRFRRVILQARLVHRLVGGGHGKLQETVGPLDLFPVHVLLRIEVLDLGGEANGLIRRIEQRDRSHAALSGEQRRPGLFDVEADGRQQAKARDDDAVPFTHDRSSPGGSFSPPALRDTESHHPR